MKTHIIFTVAATALAFWIAPDQLLGMFGLIALANGGLFLLKQIDEPLYVESDESSVESSSMGQREAA